MDTLQLPFFDMMSDARSVLIAGAGGGFDVFSGLPLYFALRAAGKQVWLANLSFSSLPPDIGRYLTPTLAEVTADSEGSKYYFPEGHLARWFRDRGETVSVYCFHRTGAKPVIDGYRTLVGHLGVDTVVLVDGGTDSLMRGDESGLGTPHEDVASIAAVEALDDAKVPRRLLVCLGFGIDAYHGVCHAHVLEAVADLIRADGYLGAFSLTESMPAVRLYREATQYVLDRTPERKSIVCTSILSALEGRYGDHHATDCTAGSELWINPLMSLYWCFQLRAVAKRLLYLDAIRETIEYMELVQAVEAFRASSKHRRPRREIPI